MSKLLLSRCCFIFRFDVVTGRDDEIEVLRAIFVSVSLQVVDGLEYMVLPFGILHVSETSNDHKTLTIL